MKHRILVLELDIHLFEAASLKDKRAVRTRLSDRLKAAYNVSVAETSEQDKWQRIGLTIAYVALDEARANRMAQTLRDACDGYLEGYGQLADCRIDIL